MSEWPVLTLAELTEPDGVLCDGDWVESKDQDPKGSNRLIQLADVGDGSFLDRSARFLNDEQFARLQCTELHPNDVLVSRMAHPLGRACVFPAQPLRCATVVDVAIVRPARRKADPRWLAYAINAPETRAAIQEQASGTTRARVSRSRLAQIPIPTPPLDEQRRIVAKLDALRARSRRAKDALDAVPALVERLRRSILAAAFRGDLTADWRAQHPDVEPATELLQRIRVERRARWEEAQLAKLLAKGKPPKDDRWKDKYVEPEPVDESELPELPDTWCWASLREVAELKGGITKGQKRVADVSLRSVPYLRVANVQRGRLALHEVASIDATENDIADLALQPGDVLFNEGGDRDKLGRGWVWEGQIPECIHQNHVFRGRVVLGEVRPKLISHFANSVGQSYFLREGSQTTNLASINITKLGALPVPLAPAVEQLALEATLAKGLARLDAIAATHERVRSAALALDSAILAAAFRGELLDRQSDGAPPSLAP